MAVKSTARLNPRHQAMVREKIRASWIIQRLHQVVAGKVEMTPVQMSAATVLLKKSIPDLTSTEMTGKDGIALNFTLLVPPKDG